MQALELGHYAGLASGLGGLRGQVLVWGGGWSQFWGCCSRFWGGWAPFWGHCSRFWEAGPGLSSSPRCSPACSVLFLGSVGTEALTGPQAVAKAVGSLLEGAPSAGGSTGPPPSPVHFKVSVQGITLTDRQRK